MPNYEALTLVTADNVRLQAYLIKRPTEAESSAAKTVLFLHASICELRVSSWNPINTYSHPTQANAGNMGHRLPVADVIYQNNEVNIFMLSYRG